MWGQSKDIPKSHRTNGRVAACLFSLIAATFASAQMRTATILGVVKDSSGAVTSDVNLTARNLETGPSRAAVSDGSGSFRFSALPVGTYEMRAEHPGFRTDMHTGLTLTVAQEAVVNFTLEVGTIEQTVAVTDEAPLVNTTSGAMGGLVEEKSIADLPLNGRNYIDLALLQTGIEQHKNTRLTGAAGGDWFSSNGAPLGSNNLLLDGALMQSIYGERD